MPHFTPHTRHRSTIPVATILAIILTILSVTLANAHPIIVRSDPQDASVLGGSPKTVRLWFSEDISPGLSTATVLDVSGNQIDGVRVSTALAHDRILDVVLPTLAPGVYSVEWKVLSEVDGHATQGHVVFGLGKGADPASIPATQPNAIATAIDVALRWINLVALTGTVGAVAIYGLLAILAVSRNDRDNPLIMATVDAASRVQTLGIWCIALGLVVGIGLVLRPIVSLADTISPVTPAWEFAWRVIGQTRWGDWWLVRQVTLLVLLVGLALSRRTRSAPTSNNIGWVQRAAAFGALAIVVVATQALSGHAAATAADSTKAVIADAGHLLAASVWIGGLVALVVGLFPFLRRRQPAPPLMLSTCFRPFGQISAVCVGVLLATGLFSAGQEVATLDALATTVYGQALIVKVTLGLVVAGVGFLSTLALSSGGAKFFGRLLRRSDDWVPVRADRLPSLLAAEAGVGVTVLLLAGVLASFPVAQGPQFDPATASPPTTLSQTVSDLLVSLEVKPNTPGPNVITIRAVSTRRPRPASIYDVEVKVVELGPNGQAISESTMRTQKALPELFRLGGDFLSHPGNWRLQVIIKRLGVADSIASFDWTVGTGAGPRPVLISNYRLEPALNLASGAILAILIAVIVVGAIRLLWGAPPATHLQRRRSNSDRRPVREYANKR